MIFSIYRDQLIHSQSLSEQLTVSSLGVTESIIHDICVVLCCVTVSVNIGTGTGIGTGWHGTAQVVPAY